MRTQTPHSNCFDLSQRFWRSSRFRFSPSPCSQPRLPARAGSTRSSTTRLASSKAPPRRDSGRAQNDPLAIEAFFPRESYRPGTTARLRFATTLRGVRLQVFHVGPEWQKTLGNKEMHGVSVTAPVLIPRIGPGTTAPVEIGNWETGLYFAQLNGPGGRIGYAPFVVPPKRLGQHRVAVVMPTRTWQAYNFRDDDRDGHGDTWYATSGHSTARLYRPFLDRGVPPHFRAYDLYFLHWLNRTGKQVDFLSQAELDGICAGDAPRPLRRSRLPRPPRVRDDRRVRRSRGVPRPRRQPGDALGRQLLLAHRPRRTGS